MSTPQQQHASSSPLVSQGGFLFSPASDTLLAAVLGRVEEGSKEWRWQPGVTPLSTWREVAFGFAVYLLVTFGGRALMRSREPFKLRGITQAHNLMLSVLSAVLLAMFVQALAPMIRQHGLYYAICDRNSWTQRLELLYYLNYLTKWLEFADTLLLVLKKKPLQFLHVYHHSLTMVLCFTQLQGTTSVSWVVVSLNLFVHVIMYYYYFRVAQGAKLWWKQWVTTIQIIQFIIDLGFVYFCTYQLVVFRYIPHLPHCGDCHGSESAAAYGCFLLSSYLFLFVQFFKRSYGKVKAKKQKLQ
ncbi:Fatty acyl-CoA elongase/Polyunsaturated fatty acid specific elongation enzyme [Spiromyces aspiralis]|uniref:Fatty acyl-CoA elongase/Polyunsaturated fatty acid specific elongation enzyme n=1 Tax=Spiromyces aspiralis TaxID=68401 RepID=A0ACC1HRS5_9FUNG|nr:Fatty acyl-CoA elongase/Polyunsaturated fatty acid specific elongation enzyme [Spiromyces aspiralis]